MLAVISGGSQGLGFAIAAEYVKKGHSVVIVARTELKLRAAVDALELARPKPEPAEYPGNAPANDTAEASSTGVAPGIDRSLLSSQRVSANLLEAPSAASEVASLAESVLAAPKQTIRYVAADVANPADCTRVFGEVGRIPDIVFCCAGAANPGYFLEQTPDELSSSFRTVYETALHFSHAGLQVMSNAPDKHNVRRTVVYCSSTAAVFPFIGYGSYAPGKAAIRALADIVRQECLAHNIRVAHILPGSMATEGYEHEELSKPVITKRIEGASPPLPADKVAVQVLKDLERGYDTIFTDTISWVLGSMMLGTSPRYGSGLLQALVGVFLAIFGPVVAWSINRDIRNYNQEVRDHSMEIQEDHKSVPASPRRGTP